MITPPHHSEIKTIAACFCAVILTSLSTVGLADTEIAYVTPSVKGTEIRLLNVQRNKSRRLFKVKRRVRIGDRIGRTLDWNPRGSELAFDSGHEALRSLYVRDVYTISSNGRRMRRITNPPNPGDFARRPKGNVVVDVRHFDSSNLSVYVQGASAPANFTARGSGTTRVTFRGVADLGRRVRQQVRVLDFDPGFSSPCWYDVGVFADVVAGRTVFAGEIDGLHTDVSCPKAFNPGWTSNGKSITLLYKTATAVGSPFNDLYKAPARPRIFEGAGRNTLIATEKQLGATTGYRVFATFMSPSRSRVGRHEMFMLEHAALTGTRVYLADIRNAQSRRRINLPCDRWYCREMQIEFLPKGDSFLLARNEEPGANDTAPPRGKILEWNVATQKLDIIVDLANVVIGEISLSSDGKKIAFTRGSGLEATAFVDGWGQRLLCPCDIWTVNRNGSGLRRLKRNARTPAWRPKR